MAVLADQEHGIYGQLAATQGERLLDRGINLHTGEKFGTSAAKIVLAHLVNVKSNQIHGRVMPLAVPAVPEQETVHDMLRVRILEVDGGDSRDLWALVSLTRTGHNFGPCLGSGSRGQHPCQQFTPSHH